MDDFFKTATDILGEVLPDTDIGKLAGLLIVAFFALIVTGRFKLEWIGIFLRHVGRWLRCKLRDRHRYYQEGIGWLDFNTGHRSGTFVCRVCGKVMVKR